MKFFLVSVCLIFLLPVTSIGVVGTNETPVHDYQASQVHISFGNTVSDIIVTWVTANQTENSVVEYGIDELVNTAYGNQTLFIDGGTEKRRFYIHTVLLHNLKQNQTYNYHCGSNLGWSDLFHFHTPPNHSNWSPSFAVYGDLGVENGESLSKLQKEAQAGMYDAFLHVGDIAYNLDSNNGRTGDEFMRQIEPIAAYVPYMTAVGNHEEAYNFSHYRRRFTMPGETEGLFYSFNIGPVHFIVFSTEFYYFHAYGLESLLTQYNWLEKDLKEASSPKNRAQRPWIITLGHRPMYCSTADRDDCSFEADYVRVGFPPFKGFGLEDLFYKYGVDIEFYGHEHTYERSWPLYNYKIYNGTRSNNPYYNPGAPIHIITGAAGCIEHVDHFKPNPGSWSAFRSSDYGYTRLKVHNASHLHLEQVSINEDGLVIDHIWVVKEKHEAYPPR